jgi:ornithine--oxo-acid transaminase
MEEQASVVGSGRDLCEALQRRGVRAKDTHGSTVRLSPPLVISQPELGQELDAVAASLADLGRRPARR